MRLDNEECKEAVSGRVRQVLESMRELAQRSRELETKLRGLNRGGVPQGSRERRERNNELSYLRADLEMSREMHTRLEGVFERLLAILDAKDAEIYMRMYRTSDRISL